MEMKSDSSTFAMACTAAMGMWQCHVCHAFSHARESVNKLQDGEPQLVDLHALWRGQLLDLEGPEDDLMGVCKT